MDNRFRHYLGDLGYLIKEAALNAKEDAGPTGGNDYAKGRLMAYYEVISLMQQQATAFHIDARELSLDDIDVDSDLL